MLLEDIISIFISLESRLETAVESIQQTITTFIIGSIALVVAALLMAPSLPSRVAKKIASLNSTMLFGRSNDFTVKADDEANYLKK